MGKLILSMCMLVFSYTAYTGGELPVERFSSVSVMTYNLENLFDTAHDPGKNDWTYMPLSVKNESVEIQKYCNELSNDFYKKMCLELDWSQETLDRKMKSLANVISLYDNGQGADIVVFQEVENIEVLKLLVKDTLKGFGYKYIALLEGPDARGIDIGMISRFPIKKQKIHNLDLKPYSLRATRPIFEVEFEAFGKSVTVLGNHWPSQSNKDETRVIASEVLRDVALNSESELVVALGDFNTTSDDELNAIELNILPFFEDVELKGRVFNQVSAPGTHWYKGGWESLDKIFILKKSLLTSKVQVDYKTYEIPYKAFMLRDLIWTDRETQEEHTSINIPHRFNSLTGEGFSDHLPVGIKIKFKID